MIYIKNNKLLLDSGKLRSCCCIDYGYNCGYCEAGKTPRQITITFSNAVVCGYGCVIYGVTRSARFESMVNFEGSYVLTQRSSQWPCTWDYYGPIQTYGYHLYYYNTVCSGEPVITLLDTLRLSVYKIAAETCQIYFNVKKDPGNNALLVKDVNATIDRDCMVMDNVNLHNVLACQMGDYGGYWWDTVDVQIEEGDTT